MPDTAIPEISAAEAEDGLWREYALARRPVVIRKLFAGQPLAEVSDVDAARRLIGTMPVVIRQEYSRGLDQPESQEAPQPQLASLDEYMTRYGQVQNSGQVVSELDAPPTLLELFEVPGFCRPTSPVRDLYFHTFLAGPDNYAQMHFDQDQRHVLLVQVFGHKRVVVMPPTAARWVRPFGNGGSIRPQAMQRTSAISRCAKSSRRGNRFSCSPWTTSASGWRNRACIEHSCTGRTCAARPT